MVEPLPVALIVHAIPNRTRVRISSRRGDTVFFASVATALAAMPGIRHVSVQPITGSVLIEHSKPLLKLQDAIADAQLFRISGPEFPRPRPSEPVVLDPKIFVGLGMAAFAILQFSRGMILPPALTLGWYAASLTGMLSAQGAPESAHE
jgi:hypothetical protein